MKSVHSRPFIYINTQEHNEFTVVLLSQVFHLLIVGFFYVKKKMNKEKIISVRYDVLYE